MGAHLILNTDASYSASTASINSTYSISFNALPHCSTPYITPAHLADQYKYRIHKSIHLVAMSTDLQSSLYELENVFKQGSSSASQVSQKLAKLKVAQLPVTMIGTS